MSRQRTHRMLALLIASVLIGSTAHARHYEHKEHHLGPTGLFGITSPTDIKITKVQKGSPADGKVKIGDVIVGVGGTALPGLFRKAHRQVHGVVFQARQRRCRFEHDGHEIRTDFRPEVVFHPFFQLL